MSKFKQFCDTYEKQLQFFETLAIILVFCLLAFLVTEKYFISYKVVLVEEDFTTGEFIVVKELIVNGKITDSIHSIDTSQQEHEKPKLIIETSCVGNTCERQNLYNISS